MSDHLMIDPVKMANLLATSEGLLILRTLAEQSDMRLTLEQDIQTDAAGLQAYLEREQDANYDLRGQIDDLESRLTHTEQVRDRLAGQLDEISKRPQPQPARPAVDHQATDLAQVALSAILCSSDEDLIRVLGWCYHDTANIDARRQQPEPKQSHLEQVLKLFLGRICYEWEGDAEPSEDICKAMGIMLPKITQRLLLIKLIREVTGLGLKPIVDLCRKVDPKAFSQNALNPNAPAPAPAA